MADGPAQQAALDGEPHLEVLGFDDGRKIGRQHRRLAARRGGQQVFGIVMLGIGEDGFDRPALDDISLCHDADPVGDASHDGEVMGDEQHGHAVLLLQIFEQRQDLRLYGHVQRRGRLVRYEQLGVVGQRHGDHDALALPARELVRKILEAAGGVGNADGFEQGDGAGPCRFPAQALMERQHLPDLPPDRVHRVERAHRLLEDHAHLIAAHRPQLRFGCAHQFLAGKADFAADLGRGRQQPECRQCRHRFARAAFAHQGQRLARGDVEADIAHRLGRAEADGKIADRQQGRAHRKVFRGSKASRIASPTKTSRVIISAMVKKPVRPSHGAWGLFLPWASSSPSEGDPGGRP